MLMKRLQIKLADTPNSRGRLERLEEEYEALMAKISDYYAVQKRMIELKKKRLVKHYESFEFVQQHKGMKQLLNEQRKSWKQLTAQYGRQVHG